MDDKIAYDMVVEHTKTPNGKTVFQVVTNVVVRRYASASFDEMGFKSVFGVIKRITPNEERKT